MWLVACIVAAVIVLALLPLLLAALILAIDGAVDAMCQGLAWCAEIWNRATHRIGYFIGRSIRAIINRVKSR